MVTNLTKIHTQFVPFYLSSICHLKNELIKTYTGSASTNP
jgi:hypothetical protein